MPDSSLPKTDFRAQLRSLENQEKRARAEETAAEQRSRTTLKQQHTSAVQALRDNLEEPFEVMAQETGALDRKVFSRMVCEEGDQRVEEFFYIIRLEQNRFKSFKVLLTTLRKPGNDNAPESHFEWQAGTRKSFEDIDELVSALPTLYLDGLQEDLTYCECAAFGLHPKLPTLLFARCVIVHYLSMMAAHAGFQMYRASTFNAVDPAIVVGVGVVLPVVIAALTFAGLNGVSLKGKIDLRSTFTDDRVAGVIGGYIILNAFAVLGCVAFTFAQGPQVWIYLQAIVLVALMIGASKPYLDRKKAYETTSWDSTDRGPLPASAPERKTEANRVMNP